MLRNNLKHLHITKKDLFQFNCLQVWCPLACCLLKAPLKPAFSDIYLTTFLWVCNFENTSEMRIIFCWKYWSLNPDFKDPETNSENLFCFWDNCIWIGCLKLSLLRREYLSSAANMVTNIPPSQLPSQWSINVAKGVRLRFQQCLVPLPCSFSKCALKREFWDIYFTTYFRVRNFGKASALRVMFLSKMFKI